MQKVVSFYEKLPRGPAPEPEGKGLLGRYQKKYFGKNASARRAYTQNNVQILRGILAVWKMLESNLRQHLFTSLAP
jgi:hypothetical protein